MKNKLANLGFALSREAQKKLVGGYMEDPGGGGTCCAHSDDWVSYVSCGLDSATAQAYASQYAQQTGNHGYWCCASCP